jgi:hypothetical protein
MSGTSFVGVYLKVEYFLTVLTIIIAGGVAITAYMQYKLAKDKFKLNLFEKRYKIYKEIESFLIDIQRDAKVSIEQKAKLYNDTQDAVFLYKDDITDYIDIIQKKRANYIQLVKNHRRKEISIERRNCWNGLVINSILNHPH